MDDTYEECLLLVTGETVSLNTFDKIFRSGYGPQWSDRPRSHTAHYSFHALFPVPEAVQRRGFDAAGRLWCKEYWESSDDLLDMQVRRALGRRQYRFFVPEPLPRTFSGLCPMIIQVLPSSWPHLCGTGAPLSLRGVRPCISICSRMECTPEAKAQIEKTHFLKYGKKWGFYHDLF